jgi:hypothetical protein
VVADRPGPAGLAGPDGGRRRAAAQHRVDHPWLAPAAEGEVHGPREFAPGPDSMARRLFADEVIEAHLDHLLASQRPDGGWTVNFPAWTEAAGLEWRAWVTVHNLGGLRSYGRLG